jgi:hypothetical protein
MTFGMISIAETTTDIITLDTPIEALNDLTLNEVFRDNNILPTPLNWTFFKWTFISNNNNIIEAQINDPNGDYYGVSIFNLNDIYYTSITAKQNTSNTTMIFVDRSPLSPFNVLTTYQTFSSLSQRNFAVFNFSGNSTSQILSIDMNYLPVVLNLTSLGLTSLTKTQLDDYYNIYMNGGYYEYDALLNDLDMTDFIIISSSFVLWLWFIRFVKGVL